MVEFRSEHCTAIMNTNDLDTVIKDYLSAKNTDYAIMISGVWGCGKSYYIDHGLKDIVSHTPFHDSNNTGKKEDKHEKFYSPAYISLYGVSSAEDFEVRVFCGINSWADNRFLKAAGALGSKTAEFFGIKKKKKDAKAITFIGKNRVLIFDDLERICDEKISVKEVLGLINSYSEHSNLKVVIVCNENEFDSDEIDENARKDYRKYKEKSVRFTYELIPDENAVYDAIVATLPKDDYRQYLEATKPQILSLFKLGGVRNLRTLKFFIDTFGKLFNAIQGFKHKDQLLKSYLITFMLYACENKRGHKVDDLKSLDISKYKLDSRAFLNVRGNEATQDDNKEKDYATIFKERYATVYGEFKPCDVLIDYIVSGYLNEVEFNKVISSLDSEYELMELKPEGVVYQKLFKMRDLNDDDVIPLINEMMSYVRADKYNLYDLLHIYALLVKYDYWKISGFVLTNALDEDFKSAMERQKDRHVFNEMFEVRTPIFDGSEQDKKPFLKYKEMKREAMGINWQAKKKVEVEAGSIFIEAAERGDVEALRKYRENTERRMSVSGLDWQRIVNLINNGSNAVACEICECLMTFISGPGILNPEETERVKKELIPALDEFLGSGKQQIRRIYIKELRDLLVDAVK